MQEKKNKEHFQNLLLKYKNGLCTPGEIREFFSFLQSDEADALLEEDMRKEFELVFESQQKEKTGPARVIHLSAYKKYAIAAAVSLGIIFSVYFFFFTNRHPVEKKILVANNEAIVPGHQQATLTMANGQKIILDSATVGKIAVMAGTVISINKKGEVVFDAAHSKQDEHISNNTVSTPTGGFFKIVLPDGSNVWLNSESALTFPSKFSGNERNVSLKGEGYFEVAKNKEKPFKVHLAAGEEITVLGTVFNVMTYANEPDQKITLLEGSINLSNASRSKILKPGQQAIVSDGLIKITNDIAIDHDIAWKNGLFDFQNDDLPAIMRQLSRWYDVQIVYNASTNSGHYTGSIRKNSGIREVLKMLEVAGNIKFSIVGKKIIVNEKS
jgi:ferric-dicitrate binding protein FerR (iron transport regulator)